MIRAEEFGGEPFPVADARGEGDIFPLKYFSQPMNILLRLFPSRAGGFAEGYWCKKTFGERIFSEASDQVWFVAS